MRDVQLNSSLSRIQVEAGLRLIASLSDARILTASAEWDMQMQNAAWSRRLLSRGIVSSSRDSRSLLAEIRVLDFTLLLL